MRARGEGFGGLGFWGLGGLGGLLVVLLVVLLGGGVIVAAAWGVVERWRRWGRRVVAVGLGDVAAEAKGRRRRRGRGIVSVAVVVGGWWSNVLVVMILDRMLKELRFFGVATEPTETGPNANDVERPSSAFKTL